MDEKKIDNFIPEGPTPEGGWKDKKRSYLYFQKIGSPMRGRPVCMTKTAETQNEIETEKYHRKNKLSDSSE